MKVRPLAITNVLLGLLVLALVANPLFASADHQPANKVAASSSNVEILRTHGDLNGGTDTVSLGSARVRTSTTADLIFKVTLECALWTTTQTLESSSSNSSASVKVWVELDGTPIPVSTIPGPADDGKVVFCDREQQMTTEGFDDEEVIELYQRTRSANAFNWVTLNVGNGIHDIEVFAELQADTDVDAAIGDVEHLAAAAVGHRMLIVQPEKFPNDAQI